jgi:hypothetical protein
VDIQKGHYYKDIYDSLVNRLTEFPDNDPSPNLRQCLGESKQGQGGLNFVRAEMLAKQHGLADDVLSAIRELALMQYMWDFDNLSGFNTLIQDFNITQSDRTRIVLRILEEGSYPFFSFSKNTEQSIDESWASRYAPNIRISTKGKQGNFLSRFFARIKSLFKRNK